MTVAVPGYEYRHLLVGKSPLTGLAATPGGLGRVWLPLKDSRK